VILLHGSHDTRAATLAHTRMLAKAGYAILAYDARGHGASAGKTNALGWRGADDLAGAVAFLQRQAGVDPHRIGALGLSMGAEEALRAAAGGVALRAVVADGAGASTSGDQHLVSSAPVALSVQWTAMRATELLSGEHEPHPLKELVGRIDVPVLLIASHRAHERTIDEAYRRRIGPRAQLWYVADAAHTKALESAPAPLRRTRPGLPRPRPGVLTAQPSPNWRARSRPQARARSSSPSSSGPSASCTKKLWVAMTS
jgi:pimeloyl-ACP methyl ester carboxylesterase